MQAHQSGMHGREKAAPKSGFSICEDRLLRGSVHRGRSSVNSRRSGFRSGSGSSGSGVRSNFSNSRSSRSGFRSSRSGFSNGFFSFLTASGQGHGSDQRSQQERLFHACVLKRDSQKTGILWNRVQSSQPHGGETVTLDSSQSLNCHSFRLQLYDASGNSL